MSYELARNVSAFNTAQTMVSTGIGVCLAACIEEESVQVLIDYSAAKTFCFCPLAYFEQYVDGRSARLKAGAEYFDFGSRMHELLEAHYLRRPSPPLSKPIESSVEDEAQATFAAYLAHYPYEDFEVLEAERLWRCSLGRHDLVGKVDMRYHSSLGHFLLDTKTEKAGSTSNDPEAWATRPQVALYEWLVEQVTGEPVHGLVINIITRQSERGRVSPSFRRLTVHRTREQQLEAVNWTSYVADQIERCQATGQWLPNRDNCKVGWRKCEFYLPHLTGWSDELRAKYAPQEDYLGLNK